MMYSLSRADKTVGIITLFPISLVTAKGTMPIVSTNGIEKTLTILDPETNEQKQITFTMDFRDLEESSLPEGKLVFPTIDDELKKSPTTKEYVSKNKIKSADLPKKRTFRDAWVHANNTIVTDIEMAKEIVRNNMRVARKQLLFLLDVAYQRADEAGDIEAKKTVAAQKQALRDVTKDPAINAATTPEQLEAVWPEILGPKPTLLFGFRKLSTLNGNNPR